MKMPKKKSGGEGYDKSGFDGSFQGGNSAKPAGANNQATSSGSDGYVNPGGGDKGERSGSKMLGKSEQKDGYDDGGIRGDFGVSGHSKKKKGY